MEPSEIMANLFDRKILKVMELFLKNEGKQFYLREISKLTKVSPASTFRILNRLTKLGILEVNEIKTAKLYNLSQGKSVDFLKSVMEVDVLQYFVEAASRMQNIEEILLLGKKEKTKANVLVLGVNVDTAAMKQLAGEIREKYDFTINQMTLSREQYEQMSSMGLYPGNKAVLFKRA